MLPLFLQSAPGTLNVSRVNVSVLITAITSDENWWNDSQVIFCRSSDNLWNLYLNAYKNGWEYLLLCLPRLDICILAFTSDKQVWAKMFTFQVYTEDIHFSLLSRATSQRAPKFSGVRTCGGLLVGAHGLPTMQIYDVLLNNHSYKCHTLTIHY